MKKKIRVRAKLQPKIRRTSSLMELQHALIKEMELYGIGNNTLFVTAELQRHSSDLKTAVKYRASVFFDDVKHIIQMSEHLTPIDVFMDMREKMRLYFNSPKEKPITAISN